MAETRHTLETRPDPATEWRVGLLISCLAIAAFVTLAAYGAFAQGLTWDDDDDDGEALAQDFRYGMACTATARSARRA